MAENVKDTKILTQNDINRIVDLFNKKVDHMPESVKIQSHLIDSILETITSR